MNACTHGDVETGPKSAVQLRKLTRTPANPNPCPHARRHVPSSRTPAKAAYPSSTRRVQGMRLVSGMLRCDVMRAYAMRRTRAWRMA